MPYASQHYPFENKESFEEKFPADFIAECLDQTRGWFYTLLVISTALFDKPPFKNLIVNGLVLAEDGKKMSKRLKNYPEPTLVMDADGADALRLYMCNSPVVRAEPLRFKQAGVRAVVKDVFLPWYHSYRFFVQSVLRMTPAMRAQVEFGTAAAAANIERNGNEMDRWVVAKAHRLVALVRQEMEGYRLYTTMPPLVVFLEQLTNSFVRFNRSRLRAGEASSLQALFEVLMILCRLMAPLTPFVVDAMYLSLRTLLPAGHEDFQDTVHFLRIPTVRDAAFNPTIERAVSRLVDAVELGRIVRERNNVSLRTPLRRMIVVHHSAEFQSEVEPLRAYL